MNIYKFTIITLIAISQFSTVGATSQSTKYTEKSAHCKTVAIHTSTTTPQGAHNEIYKVLVYKIATDKLLRELHCQEAKAIYDRLQAKHFEQQYGKHK